MAGPLGTPFDSNPKRHKTCLVNIIKRKTIRISKTNKNIIEYMFRQPKNLYDDIKRHPDNYKIQENAFCFVAREPCISTSISKHHKYAKLDYRRLFIDIPTTTDATTLLNTSTYIEKSLHDDNMCNLLYYLLLLRS